MPAAEQACAYEPVIGLEVHAQLFTRTKLFCGCETGFGAPPNTHTCPVCLGLPGALPVTNAAAVGMAVRVGLALGCTVEERSVFARKNYFYPDLAKGYQISQYEDPICTGGAVSIRLGDNVRAIPLERIHLEEDAAKNIHTRGSDTLVDFNRAGVPLIEIVTRPALRSTEEAELYLKALRETLMFLGVNDGNLEEGSFRCDVNVSLRPAGTTELGTRTELKNINSFRFVRKALQFEIARQESVLSSGQAIVQETRTWDADAETTAPMRGKEEAKDYRYFPDPDLPPLVLSRAFVDEVRAALPELPGARRARFVAELGVTDYDARVLTGHPRVADFFEETTGLLAEHGGSDGDAATRAQAGKQVANFVQSEVLGSVEVDGLDAEFPVGAPALAELLSLVADGTIHGKTAKQVFAQMAVSGEGARSIVDAQGLAQLSDVSAIEALVRASLEAHPKQVAQYRAGKSSLVGFFVGQVMKASGGAANPKTVSELLRRCLGEDP